MAQHQLRQFTDQKRGPGRPRKPNNLVYLHRDRGYRFEDADPILEQIRSIIFERQLSVGDVVELVLDVSNNAVHISYGTIQKWLDGTTKRPHHFTVKWVTYALGYDYILVPQKD